VDSDVLTFFPSNDMFTTTTQQYATFFYLGTIAELGNTQRPIDVAYSLSATDKTYILDWMFKFAANAEPPNSFADETTLEAFEDTAGTNTSYKLFNRLQIKYLVNGSQFKAPPTLLEDDVLVGTTVDPIFGSLRPAQQGPAFDQQTTTGGNVFHQIVDGSPEAVAVSAFNALTSPLEWNDIGDRIDEGVPLDTGSPFPARYSVENQIYPTYYIYERESDGGFYLITTIPEASSPSDNFDLVPYYVTTPNGYAPFLLPH
jgi:hypothetical protein